MNPISSMKHTLLAYGVAAVFLGAASLASASNEGVVQTAGNITYVSGGVGTESLDHLGSITSDFNLKLIFALNSGEYLSNVNVAITDAKGQSMVDTTSEGPWFLARLPKGNYRVVATVAGKAEKRQIAIGAAKLRTIDFRWAAE